MDQDGEVPSSYWGSDGPRRGSKKGHSSHDSQDGNPKIVRECRYELTARQCVSLIVTDMAVIEVTPGGLVLKEIAPGLTPDEIQAVTEPPLIIAGDIKEIEL